MDTKLDKGGDNRKKEGGGLFGRHNKKNPHQIPPGPGRITSPALFRGA